MPLSLDIWGHGIDIVDILQAGSIVYKSGITHQNLLPCIKCMLLPSIVCMHSVYDQNNRIDVKSYNVDIFSL